MGNAFEEIRAFKISFMFPYFDRILLFLNERNRNLKKSCLSMQVM